MPQMPGGGGGCAAISNAAMAIETGQAEVVVVYRSLCQGQFFRFGCFFHLDPRPPQPLDNAAIPFHLEEGDYAVGNLGPDSRNG